MIFEERSHSTSLQLVTIPPKTAKNLQHLEKLPLLNGLGEFSGFLAVFGGIEFGGPVSSEANVAV